MTAGSLKMAPGLSIPLDAVSRTFGVLAVRGAGKSNLAAVMAEEMFAAGLPFVVIDPVGSWYGLRSSADGTSAGLPVPIFGGKHGDVPLERGSGELIADLVVEKRLTCVLDLSRFDSESDKKVFLLAFARRLYQKNENPLHLFLEEADDYIPQSPMGDEKHLLRAWENIVRRGRARGLGMTLITQRSAAVAKMVLTQVETLFAMRTTGPQDIAAIEAWVKYHQVGKGVLSTLASLDDGEAWVWSPHYLKTMARHQMRRRSTFDSGATPKNVRAKDTRPPATLADIDLAALQERMAATIEKAKADDPKELRKALAEKDRRILELERRAAVVPSVSVPVLTDDDRELLRDVATRLAEASRKARINADFDVEIFMAQARAAIEQLTQDITLEATDLADVLNGTLAETGLQQILDRLLAHQPPAVRAWGQRFEAAGHSTSAPAPAPVTSRPRSSAPSTSGSSDLPKGEVTVLTCVAQYPEGASREQISILTGYKRSTRDLYLQQLQRRGAIDAVGGTLHVTAAGMALLGPDFEPLPTGAALIDHWRQRLPTGERAVFEVLVAAHGRVVDRDRISEVTGYKRSTRDLYIQQLTRRRLAVSDRGGVRAAAELFA